MIDSARFYSRVERGNGCWLWSGHRSADGYGKLTIGRSAQLAHRVSWQLHHGPIPAGLRVLHRCDNPPCVNPDHLFLGTQADNVRDMHAKNRARKALWMASPFAKLTDDDVRAIRREYAGRRVSQQSLATRFGVSQHLVSRIVRGTLWRHVGF